MHRKFKEQVKNLEYQHKELYKVLCKMSTLEDLFAWIRTSDSIGEIDILAQDEFSHDLTIHILDQELYLVISST